MPVIMVMVNGGNAENFDNGNNDNYDYDVNDKCDHFDKKDECYDYDSSVYKTELLHSLKIGD